MNKESAIIRLKEILFRTIVANECGLSNNDFKDEIDCYNTILEVLEKQDEIIDLMSNYIWKYDCCEYEIGKKGKCPGYYLDKDCTNKCIKEYFKNKVQESEKNEI